jgi:flagellar protein FliO/FliZ
MFRPIPAAALPLALAVAVSPAPTFAQTAATADLGGSALQLFLSLALIFALLGGSLWLLKRLSAPRGTAGGLMKVVAATAVGTRERVVVLEVGSTWLVLGVAPGRVSALAEVPRQPLPAAPAGEPHDAPAWLKQLVGRRHAR